MSNIAIYGLGKDINRDVCNYISEILRKSNLPREIYNELVITYVPSECYEAKFLGKFSTVLTQSFLRVYGTDEGEIKYIAELLQEHDYEVETLLIHKFYSKP